MAYIYKPVINIVKTAEKLKSFRLQNSYDVAQLQEIFLIKNRQVIYNWESGKNLPSVFMLMAFASLYGVKVTDLLSWDTVEIEIKESEIDGNLKNRLTEINERMTAVVDCEHIENSNFSIPFHVLAKSDDRKGESLFDREVSEIKERLIEYRVKNGFTVQELQTILQMENFQSIYNWEEGKNLPSIDNALILSKLYQVPIEELFPVLSLIIPKKTTHQSLKESLALALHPLISQEKLSYYDVSEMLSLSRLELIDIYGSAGIPYVDMTREELLSDLETLRRLSAGSNK